MIITNHELQSRMIALDSIQSYIVMIVQEWDQIGFGDADTSNNTEIARLTTHYIDTYRQDILPADRDYAYQTVWAGFRQALPEINDPV